MDQGYKTGGIQGDANHVQYYQQRRGYKRVSGKNVSL